MISIFLVTVIFVMWRPRGINEALPTSIAAATVLVIGFVPLTDMVSILKIVSGASITILSTIVMSIVLESIGFFRWAALNLAIKAKGSGVLLFWYINLLCFLMTLFFNNDGSILITTPIIIHTLSMLKLKPHQKVPFLISGALVATAASAPIGVSNLANLISLQIVGLDLNTYAKMMFVPSMLGIGCMALMLFLIFRKDISIGYKTNMNQQFMIENSSMRSHPLSSRPQQGTDIDWKMFRISIGVVIATRLSFFVLAPLGIPTEWPAIIGAIILILIRWFKKQIGPADVLRKSPWSIILFAFSMYIIIYGLHNSGMTALIVKQFGDTVATSPFHAIFTMGGLLTVLSNLCNNLPSVMIGTLSIKEMGLDLHLQQISYLANVIGADIGSLILPMGTLASLLWMHTLRQHNVPMHWGKYLQVTIVVVPLSLFVSLLGLFIWTSYVSF
ncbi:arsenic transporter [Paenibacillus sp. GCM10023248]|uniref:arsenic transporter n=1 Tax=Bacillales TaxID=1385 RepID=UPI002379229D|nr:MULTISPECIES: arsenic transporter [Bacillales]MDD9269985.1 arsenic transporter [Paenibacillus sp. MAHUQ-63]MDR6883206.1 arsenical pump membrane protein [Bacillus sp. 3255]